jgi:hypothetical protein
MSTVKRIPTLEETPCELIKTEAGYLQIVCTTCREMCNLELGPQRRSTSGHGQNNFQVVCPTCGPLRPQLISKW